MTTPAFVAQGQNTLSEIRYYTAFDPYFYTVDNRPLQDIETNLVRLGSQGADSARRAVILNQLGTSTAYADLYPLGGSYLAYMTGLAVSLRDTVVFTIGEGAVYFKDVINGQISNQVVKQAVLLSPKVFTLTSPPAGQVKNVLVQAELRSVTQANMADSALPFLDATNPLLDSLLLNYELVVSVKQGGSATLGNQVTPTVDPGKIELFVLTYHSDPNNSTVARHPLGPSLRGADKAYPLIASNTFVTDVNNYLVLPVSLRDLHLNPLKPIAFQIRYSSSSSGGNIAVKMEYRAMSLGGAIDTALSTLGSEIVPAPATPNTLAAATLTTNYIPNTAFAGWDNGNWIVKADSLNILFNRMGAQAEDTNTGTLTLHEVRVYQ